MREPTFTEPQITVAIVFASIALTLVLLFAFIALRARREQPIEEVRAAAYRLRPWWLTFLVTLLAAAVFISFFHLPFTKAQTRVTEVRVSGGQFYWSVSPPSVPAGTTVRFVVTGVDVNHSLGLYDPDGGLVGVVQAMPGYQNKLDISLDKPGVYEISCLEYCGLNHHRMHRTFRVTRRPA